MLLSDPDGSSSVIHQTTPLWTAQQNGCLAVIALRRIVLGVTLNHSAVFCTAEQFHVWRCTTTCAIGLIVDTLMISCVLLAYSPCMGCTLVVHNIHVGHTLRMCNVSTAMKTCLHGISNVAQAPSMTSLNMV